MVVVRSAARGRVVAGGVPCLHPVVAGVCWVGCAHQLRSVSLGISTIVVMWVLLLSLPLLGWALGGERWQDTRCHGSARKTPQDQHHHQHEIEAATHL